MTRPLSISIPCQRCQVSVPMRQIELRARSCTVNGCPLRGKPRLRVVSIALALLAMVATAPAHAGGKVIPHPSGCPSRAFCACGASVKVFGQSVRALWPSSAWLQFPRTSPGHMKVAARRGHVFVIDFMIDAKTAMAWDYNSGKRLSRYHARSIVGYAIVDPNGARHRYAEAKAAAQAEEKQP